MHYLFPGRLINRQNVSLLLLGSLSFSIFAQEFESPEEQVQLIELYTSEGCSSCPPADRWLSSLKNSDSLWSRFVPLAFHVDYWDYIGWKDPYASREHSQRQRRYAREFGESTVYTPGVRKAGEEWRNWRSRPNLDELSGQKVGKLAINVERDGRFKASFSSDKPMQLNIALLGLDLSNEVSRGENRGRTLEHDFVVLGVSSYSTADVGQWQGELPQPSTPAKRYAVAAWVTQGGSLAPVQATGGYLALN